MKNTMTISNRNGLNEMNVKKIKTNLTNYVIHGGPNRRNLGGVQQLYTPSSTVSPIKLTYSSSDTGTTEIVNYNQLRVDTQLDRLSMLNSTEEEGGTTCNNSLHCWCKMSLVTKLKCHFERSLKILPLCHLIAASFLTQSLSTSALSSFSSRSWSARFLYFKNIQWVFF